MQRNYDRGTISLLLIITSVTLLVAVSEQGLRIMAMLYLTPVLPLGPVSYMCGTTSMALSSFAMAKVASLPLMILYVFIGASTGTLLSDPSGSEAKKIEENKTLIVMGILLSAVMITCISHYIRKELDKVSLVVWCCAMLCCVSHVTYSLFPTRYWNVKRRGHRTARERRIDQCDRAARTM